MSNILVDADACPVKEEIYRVAKRYKLKVILVVNSWMKTPESGKQNRIIQHKRLHMRKNDKILIGIVQ